MTPDTTTVVAWIAGAFLGAVLWSAFLRLLGPLARWLCSHLQSPGRLVMVISMTVSVVFLTLVAAGALIGLSLLVGHGAHSAGATNMKAIRASVFLSSLCGYAVFQLTTRVAELVRRRRYP